MADYVNVQHSTMLANNALTTVELVNQLSNNEYDEDVVIATINSASDYVERITGRNCGYDKYTEEVRAFDAQYYFTRQFPIVKVDEATLEVEIVGDRQLYSKYGWGAPPITTRGVTPHPDWYDYAHTLVYWAGYKLPNWQASYPEAPELPQDIQFLIASFVTDYLATNNQQMTNFSIADVSWKFDSKTADQVVANYNKKITAICGSGVL